MFIHKNPADLPTIQGIHF